MRREAYARRQASIKTNGSEPGRRRCRRIKYTMVGVARAQRKNAVDVSNTQTPSGNVTRNRERATDSPLQNARLALSGSRDGSGYFCPETGGPSDQVKSTIVPDVSYHSSFCLCLTLE
jgi:hypothetical protein